MARDSDFVPGDARKRTLIDDNAMDGSTDRTNGT